MRRARRVAGAVVACLLLASGTAVADVESADVVAISWKPCVEDATAECGVVRVPVDWAAPLGASLEMAVSRRKATDPGRRVGVLLVNPGGPGGSGVSFVQQVRSYFSPEVQARFDLVGFDPRGVARSKPVLCSTSVLERQPSVHPATQAEYDRLVAFNRELKADCAQTSGPIVDHVDTLAVAKDVEVLRKALGEAKVNFYGVFYGTLIGQQYAELYGDRVRTMVLDGNLDHSVDARQFVSLAAMATEDAFNQFVAWCAVNTACAVHGRDVPALWDDILARADRGEIIDPRGAGTLSCLPPRR